MKARSTIAPESFKIGDRKGNLIEVTFFDDIKEIQEEDETLYEYSVYKITTIYRNDLEQAINDNLNDWLVLAKTRDYEAMANKVREVRDKLLAESDQHLLLDRIGLNIPSEITAGNLLSTIKTFFTNFNEILNGEWAEYRQKLRDITKQEGFPYNVEFPDIPVESKSNKED